MSMTNIPADATGFEKWCRENGVGRVVVGSADTNGTWVGKRISLENFLGLLASETVPGQGFSDVFLVVTRDGWDVAEPAEGTDTLFPNKENGFPDVFLRPELETARHLQWHEGTVAINGEFLLSEGGEVPIGPRTVLRRLVRRLDQHSLSVKSASEFELYLLNRSPDALCPEGYPLDPAWPRPNVYQAYRSNVDSARVSKWETYLAGAGVNVEAVHPENGPGQYEVILKYDEIMRSADDAFMFKSGLKELAALDDTMVTFMALPRSDWPGSSCHIHQSLWDAEGEKPLFWNPNGKYGLSEIGERYLAGMLATMKEFTAIFRPTINSYKRARPYSWAGTTVSWGYDNRSTGIRMVGEGASSCRLEQRVGGADVNPYLAVAACLAGGIYGIENDLEPPAPFHGDAYVDKSLDTLPRTLTEALDLLEASTIARTYFGDDFVNHYVLMKRKEVDSFNSSVTDWEVREYAETA